MRYVARCPLRLDIAGYWTSLSPFAEREGGVVVAVSIEPHVTGEIARPQPQGALHALRGDRHYMSATLDLPRGSGLGASAAQTVLWLTLAQTVVANVADRMRIAEVARNVEVALGAGGVAVDPYACAHGGWASFTIDEAVTAAPLVADPGVLRAIETQLLLVYTGPAPPSPALHSAVSSHCAIADSRVASTLFTMKELAQRTRQSIEAGDAKVLAETLRLQWNLQKQLDERVSSPTIDAILEFSLENGAVAGRLCGAGGGGFLLLLVPPERQAGLRTALTSHHLKYLAVRSDSYGVHLRNQRTPLTS
ncbi:MAG: dehydrogenase [Chloroflexota bacterium]